VWIQLIYSFEIQLIYSDLESEARQFLLELTFHSYEYYVLYES
jgi:hypothetical protein